MFLLISWCALPLLSIVNLMLVVVAYLAVLYTSCPMNSNKVTNSVLKYKQTYENLALQIISKLFLTSVVCFVSILVCQLLFLRVLCFFYLRLLVICLLPFVRTVDHSLLWETKQKKTLKRNNKLPKAIKTQTKWNKTILVSATIVLQL